jgi:hypothetical protein
MTSAGKTRLPGRCDSPQASLSTRKRRLETARRNTRKAWAAPVRCASGAYPAESPMPTVPPGARQSTSLVSGRRWTGEDLRVFLSAIWRRREGIRAPSFGTGRGLKLRRDGTASRPQASTRRPGRSLVSVPLGRTDGGLKDGAGLLSRKRSIRMASEERALAVRSGAHPGSDAGAAGRLVRGLERAEPSGARRCRPRPRPACTEAKVDACGCWMPGPGLPRRSTGKGPAAFSCRSPCRLRRRQSAPRFAGRGARGPLGLRAPDASNPL